MLELELEGVEELGMEELGIELELGSEELELELEFSSPPKQAVKERDRARAMAMARTFFIKEASFCGRAADHNRQSHSWLYCTTKAVEKGGFTKTFHPLSREKAPTALSGISVHSLGPFIPGS